MSIEVKCQCGKAYKMPDSAAGKKKTCAQCNNKMQIPNLKSAPSKVNIGSLICEACGESIPTDSRICPSCDEPIPATTASNSTPSKKSRESKQPKSAVLRALFLGFVGAHHFYLGSKGWGIISVLLCLTGIPCLLSLIDVVALVTMGKKHFNAKYNDGAVTAWTMVAFPVALPNKSDKRIVAKINRHPIISTFVLLIILGIILTLLNPPTANEWWHAEVVAFREAKRPSKKSPETRSSITAADKIPPPPKPSRPKTYGVNIDGFNAIQMGMSYEEVKTILGKKGDLSSDSEMDGYDIKIYTWSKGWSGANMIIMFEGDRVSNKTQAGF